jgi:SAM-dependent methyltransferase
VLIPFREAGIDIDGLDFDQAMLDDARRKLAARGLTATLLRADMRDFTMPRRYGLVFIAFNTFLHNRTTADQVATLRCCREHLAPGGILMLDVFVPSIERLLDHGERLQFDHPHPSGRGTIQVYDTASDVPVEQLRDFQRRVEVRDENGALLESHQMEFGLRYVWKHEMELLLRTAGFTRWSAEARLPGRGFAKKDRIEPGDMLMWTAWKV